MHLFHPTTLLYLSFHALAFVLLFVSVMGIPGKPDERKAISRLLLKTWNIGLLLAWRGIPALAVAALLAFFLHYDVLGKIISCTSLALGSVLFLSALGYYISLPENKVK